MNTSEKVKVFREILLHLFDRHASDVGRDGLVYEQEIADVFTVLYRSLNRSEELEQLLPNTGSRVKGNFGNRLLCLPVPGHGSVGYPVLSISYNFGCSIPEVSLRIGFLKKCGNEVKGYGYRLDPPHGQGREGGIHHFYHQQVIHSLADMTLPKADELSWISETEPSFPLDAKDCIELLLCLIAALYGRIETNTFVLGLNRHIRDQVNSVLKGMNLSKFDDLNLHWFWKLESDAGNTVYYETNQEENSFRAYATPLHENHSFLEITPEEYANQPAGQRKKRYLLDL